MRASSFPDRSVPPTLRPVPDAGLAAAAWTRGGPRAARPHREKQPPTLRRRGHGCGRSVVAVRQCCGPTGPGGSRSRRVMPELRRIHRCHRRIGRSRCRGGLPSRRGRASSGFPSPVPPGRAGRSVWWPRIGGRVDGVPSPAGRRRSGCSAALLRVHVCQAAMCPRCNCSRVTTAKVWRRLCGRPRCGRRGCGSAGSRCEQLLPGGFRHRGAHLGQPEHGRLQPVRAVDQQPQTFAGSSCATFTRPPPGRRATAGPGPR